MFRTLVALLMFAAMLTTAYAQDDPVAKKAKLVEDRTKKVIDGLKEEEKKQDAHLQRLKKGVLDKTAKGVRMPANEKQPVRFPNKDAKDKAVENAEKKLTETKKEGESDDDFKKRVAKAEKELALKKIYVPYVADILQTGFFQKLYTEPGLDKIFSNWYGRLTSKQSYDDAIRAYLGRTSNKFDAFAMQEVSTKGMYDQLANAHIPGYCVQMEKSGDTTTGAVLVRLPEGDVVALRR
jgi:flavin-binding protein dodecin